MIRTFLSICAVSASALLLLSSRLEPRDRASLDSRALLAPPLHHYPEAPGPDARGNEAAPKSARLLPAAAGGSEPTATTTSAAVAAAAADAEANRTVLHTCSCLGASSPAPLRGRFRWLHIPKTGTSFIATLYAHSCSSERGRIDLAVSPHYRAGCGQCFDMALLARYPPETHCRRDSFDSFETQHRALNGAEVARAERSGRADADVYVSTEGRIDLVGFFRRPQARVVSAFDNAMHAVGMPGEAYREMKVRCKGNVTCYATDPAVGGCMAKMLTGKDCAQPVGAGGVDARGALAALEAMSFVGITEDWNEAVCQFHRVFGGVPSQGQFQNVHRGKRKSKVDDLPESYRDEADEAVYAAALDKFGKMVGEERCHRTVEVEPGACLPRSCADLGTQCGEWPDGCGGTVACGVCGSTGRDALPDDWRNACVEGTCVRTCPTWVEGGLWFRGPNRTRSEWTAELRGRGAPVDVVVGASGVARPAKPERRGLEMLSSGDDDDADAPTHVTPSDAIRLCADACRSRDGAHKRFAAGFCSCGAYPWEYLRNPPRIEEYRAAHDLIPTERSPPGKKGATTTGGMVPIKNMKRTKVHQQLKVGESRPRCCPPDSAATATPPEGGSVATDSLWRAGFVWADFFESIDLGCEGHEACEAAGVRRGADVVVVDVKGHVCRLGMDAGGVLSLPVPRHYLRLTPANGRRDGPPLVRA